MRVLPRRGLRPLQLRKEGGPQQQNCVAWKASMLSLRPEWSGIDLKQLRSPSGSKSCVNSIAELEAKANRVTEERAREEQEITTLSAELEAARQQADCIICRTFRS